MTDIDSLINLMAQTEVQMDSSVMAFDIINDLSKNDPFNICVISSQILFRNQVSLYVKKFSMILLNKTFNQDMFQTYVSSSDDIKDLFKKAALLCINSDDKVIIDTASVFISHLLIFEKEGWCHVIVELMNITRSNDVSDISKYGAFKSLYEIYSCNIFLTMKVYTQYIPQIIASCQYIECSQAKNAVYYEEAIYLYKNLVEKLDKKDITGIIDVHEEIQKICGILVTVECVSCSSCLFQILSSLLLRFYDIINGDFFAKIVLTMLMTVLKKDSPITTQALYFVHDIVIHEHRIAEKNLNIEDTNNYSKYQLDNMNGYSFVLCYDYINLLLEIVLDTRISSYEFFIGNNIYSLIEDQIKLIISTSIYCNKNHQYFINLIVEYNKHNNQNMIHGALFIVHSLASLKNYSVQRECSVFLYEYLQQLLKALSTNYEMIKIKSLRVIKSCLKNYSLWMDKSEKLDIIMNTLFSMHNESVPVLIHISKVFLELSSNYVMLTYLNKIYEFSNNIMNREDSIGSGLFKHYSDVVYSLILYTPEQHFNFCEYIFVLSMQKIVELCLNSNSNINDPTSVNYQIFFSNSLFSLALRGWEGIYKGFSDVFDVCLKILSKHSTIYPEIMMLINVLIENIPNSLKDELNIDFNIIMEHIVDSLTSKSPEIIRYSVQLLNNLFVIYPNQMTLYSRSTYQIIITLETAEYVNEFIMREIFLLYSTLCRNYPEQFDHQIRCKAIQTILTLFEKDIDKLNEVDVVLLFAFRSLADILNCNDQFDNQLEGMKFAIDVYAASNFVNADTITTFSDFIRNLVFGDNDESVSLRLTAKQIKDLIQIVLKLKNKCGDYNFVVKKLEFIKSILYSAKPRINI